MDLWMCYLQLSQLGVFIEDSWRQLLYLVGTQAPVRRFFLDLNLKYFVWWSVANKQFDIFLSWIYIFYAPFPCHNLYMFI